MYLESMWGPDLMAIVCMYMTSPNGNIFCVTGQLCGEFTDHWWIPCTKASDADLDVFFDLWLNKRLSKQSWDWWFETPSCSFWRHYFDERVGVRWGTTSVGTLATFCYFYSSVFFLRNMWCSYENDFVIAPPTCCKSDEETNYSAEWWHWVF